MKKLIDIDGLKIFVERVRKEIDRNFTMLINTQNNLFGGVYQAMGWTDKNRGYYEFLKDRGLNSNNILDALGDLKAELGKTDAEAGTGTAFARIKKLETTAITADDLAAPIDMDYLSKLYVDNDASTISTIDKNAIIAAFYGNPDFKPEYLS